jgi:spore maturation protein CgeB
MSSSLRLAYLAHSLRSDWNNGNAHFLRGLMRSMVELGHQITVFEPCTEWSVRHLREEKEGERALYQFSECYPELRIFVYTSSEAVNRSFWRDALKGHDIVILHEWNPPALAHLMLQLRDELDFRLLFHDTHHRASSSPEQIRLFDIAQFDGVLVFGEALRDIYQRQFGIQSVWTLHEAADTSIFHPQARVKKTTDVLWIGNWGDGERSDEIREFLLNPATALSPRRFTIFGVRYPDDGLTALDDAGVRYGGYLPNLDAPYTYAGARLTVHIPRQQYITAMAGIPTIRVFEALACGIPLISAPWQDIEKLFREGDFIFARNGEEMKRAMEKLLSDESAASAQALRGLETILSRHTCRHRAEELTSICEEILH